MIKIKSIKPRYTTVITTFDKYTEPEKIVGSDIIDPEKSKVQVKEYQKVLKVGPMVRDIKEGDIVMINPLKYAKFKQAPQNSLKNDMTEYYKKEIVGFEFPLIQIDGEDRMYLDERDILYVIDDFEVDDTIPQE